MKADKNNLINKFMQIEMLAHRMEEMAHIGRHLVESMSVDKMILICKRIRHDLEDLEVMLGVED